MTKVAPKRLFHKVYRDILKGRIKAREALIYGIIAEYEVNGLPCFISRQELAKRINESQATAERSVQLMIKLGLLRATRNGRKRYLCTVKPGTSDLYQVDTGPANDLYQVDTSGGHDLYQIDTQSVSNHGSDLYQVDTLIRSINQNQIIRSTNEIYQQPDSPELINDFNEKGSNTGHTASEASEGEESMERNETEKEKKIRLRLEQLRKDPEGWEDKGTHLEKYDPETRTVMKKPRQHTPNAAEWR